MKTASMLLLGLLLSFAALAEGMEDKRAWDRGSDPLWLKVTNRSYDSLPLAGAVANPHRYWSSDFWSKKRGGINYRWNARKPVGQGLKSPSKQQVAVMTLAELAELAPSEKLDLLSGNYEYPLKREIAKYADRSAPSWEGICNGWSEASLHHDEPLPVTLTNPDGFVIPFGSSDIKALLSWYYFRKSAVEYARMGSRCYNKADTCSNDLNAGAFHLVLANRIGLEGGSFIADIDRGNEVWNHTAFNYSSRVISSDSGARRSSARGTKRIVRVKTEVNYTFTLKKNMWAPALGTPEQKLTKRVYEYYLELDAARNVIGGEWISRERPDFMWTSAPATDFSGNMAALSLLATLPVLPEVVTTEVLP